LNQRRFLTPLQQQLELANIRELEDLIIDCIYAGLLRAKLDQRDKQVQVDFCIARDLRPGQLERMISTLQQWVQTSDVLLQTLDTELKRAGSAQDSATAHRLEYEQRIEQLKSNLKATMESEGGGEGMQFGDDDRMRKKSGGKGRPFGGLPFGGGGRKGPMGAGGRRGFMRDAF